MYKRFFFCIFGKDKVVCRVRRLVNFVTSHITPQASMLQPSIVELFVQGLLCIHDLSNVVFFGYGFIKTLIHFGVSNPDYTSLQEFHIIAANAILENTVARFENAGYYVIPYYVEDHHGLFFFI